jgi:hypothetical protein
LIHEYYHQRLWQWWTYCPLVESYQEELKIKSPISGNERSVISLLQALLIYIGLLDYYTEVLYKSNGETTIFSTWQRKRIENFTTNIPVLFNILKQSLLMNERVDLYLNLLMKEFFTIKNSDTLSIILSKKT